MNLPEASDQMRPRTVRPYGLVDKSGEHYLVAHDLATGETRSFRVDRIRRAKALPGTFELPANIKGIEVGQGQAVVVQ